MNARSFLLHEFALQSIVICFAIFGIVCISFTIVGIETAMKSWRQTVELPVGMGSLWCWESWQLIVLEMFGPVLFYLFVYYV
jgi:hypothetical protein